MPIPRIALDDHVPDSILRDVRKTMSQQRLQGATHWLIRVPAEDFATTIDKVMKKVRGPFRPTICGQPCDPWEKSFVGVMARVDKQQKGPIIFDANGREHEVI
jgi:hypothetical protein